MDEKKASKELKSGNLLRRVYDDFAAGVAYISVVNANGDEGIGSCFHIGDGVFITAKHVVKNCAVKEIGTTLHQVRYFETEDTPATGMARTELTYVPQTTPSFKGPFFHPDENVDVAAIVVPGVDAPVLSLGDHLDDWLGDEYILSDVLVMGYPPVPFAPEPLLIVSKCEVNAVLDKYTGGHPHFLVSSMARGGFSGGPAITEDGIVLGVVTESLVVNNQPAELGYLSVLSVEGIYTCISHHRIVPRHIDEQWKGFWNKQSTLYANSSSAHVDVSIYRGHGRYYFEIFSYRTDILDMVIQLIDDNFGKAYTLEWYHDNMVKIEFVDGGITEGNSDKLYSKILEMIDALGIPRFDQKKE
jgi:hypothetical protein